jgi:hypothetical protein
MAKFIKAKDVVLSDVGHGDEGPDDLEIGYDEFLGMTKEAALFVIDEEEYWIPRSTIIYLYSNQIELKEWIAIEKGLV